MTKSLRIALGLFAKFPEAGRVKTRLVPMLGEEGAARFARWLLFRALEKVSAFAVEGALVQVNLWTDGGTSAQWKALLARLQLPISISLLPQVQGDLGGRMQHAMRIQLDQSDVSILLGPDAVDFDQSDFRELLAAVADCGMAFTPAFDGGYVAMASDKIVDCVFSSEIRWGTSTVAEQTRQLLQDAAESARWLSPQADIDEPADLQRALANGSVPNNWMDDYIGEI